MIRHLCRLLGDGRVSKVAPRQKESKLCGLVYYFNIVSRKSPAYLCSLLPAKQQSYDPLRSNLFRNFTSHTNFYQNSFFSYCTSEWNKLGPNLRNSNSVAILKKNLLAFVRPKQCNIYNIVDPSGLKLLKSLRVNLSHLREHKFRHNFLNTLNPLCSCSLEIESTTHYLLHCPFYTHLRRTLLDNILELIDDISNFSDDKLTNLLLYGDSVLNVEVNASILKNTIIFLKVSERFYIPLL